MFSDILVPLDGSDLSERALPMAQKLAQSSEATVHLIHMVSREHDLGAGRGIESVQAAEMEMDMARRLTESRLHRGRMYPGRHCRLPAGRGYSGRGGGEP